MGQISLPLPDHDAALPGDILTTVSINHEWRRFIVHKIEDLLNRDVWIGTDAEIDIAIQQVHNLLADFYTQDATAMTYIGVLVARTTNYAFGTAVADVFFDDNSSHPNHDTDLLWKPAFPPFVTVPSGLGGFYSIYAEARLDPTGTGVLFLEIAVNGVIVAATRWRQDSHMQPLAQVTLSLVADDKISVVLRTFAGTRNAIASGGIGWSVRLGMYRVGDAP